MCDWSFQQSVLLNSMYKSCPLFVLTTKIELSMPVQSLNIDLSNAAICRLSCSSEGGGGEGEEEAS